MNVMLHNRNGVHHSDEDRGEHEPVIERRPVQVVAEPPRQQERDRDLNERFHPVTLPPTHRFGKCPFQRPFVERDALPQDAIGYAGFARPFGDGKSAPLPRHKHVHARVVGLNIPVSPPAILRRVVAMVVDAVERAALWPLAHICNKSRKIIPSRTNGNAPAAVSAVALIVGVVATGAHGRPNLVEGMSFTVSGEPVLEPVVDILRAETSTRDAIPTPNALAIHASLRSASATREPVSRLAGVTGQHRPSPEFLIGQVNKGSHPPIVDGTVLRDNK